MSFAASLVSDPDLGVITRARQAEDEGFIEMLTSRGQRVQFTLSDFELALPEQKRFEIFEERVQRAPPWKRFRWIQALKGEPAVFSVKDGKIVLAYAGHHDELGRVQIVFTVVRTKSLGHRGQRKSESVSPSSLPPRWSRPV